MNRRKSRVGLIAGTIILGHGIVALFAFFFIYNSLPTLFNTILYSILGIFILIKWEKLKLWLKWSLLFIASRFVYVWISAFVNQLFFPIEYASYELTKTQEAVLSCRMFINTIISFPFVTYYEKTIGENGQIIFVLPYWKMILRTILDMLWVGTLGALSQKIIEKLSKKVSR